jgi:hypothetical protein
MVYCKECVKTNYCFDMRKRRAGSLDCHKFKDRDYNDSSRDGDCDSVAEGAFGDSKGIFSGLDRNIKFRNVEGLVCD